MNSKNNCTFHPTSCLSFLISYTLTCSQYTLCKRLVVLPLPTPWKTLMIGKALTSRPLFNMEIHYPAHYFSLTLLILHTGNLKCLSTMASKIYTSIHTLFVLVYTILMLRREQVF